MSIVFKRLKIISFSLKGGHLDMSFVECKRIENNKKCGATRDKMKSVPQDTKIVKVFPKKIKRPRDRGLFIQH